MSFASKAETGAARISGTEEAGEEDMFTIKAISTSGAETVFEGLIARRITPDSGSVAGPGVVVEREGKYALHIHLAGESEGCQQDGVEYHEADVVYVMNRFGATVATYRAIVRPPMPMAA